MIGTNDVDTGFDLASTDVPNVQTRLGGLISSIEGNAPLAHLIVAQITPNLGSTDKDAAVQQFNADVAASVKAAGGNVAWLTCMPHSVPVCMRRTPMFQTLT